MTLLLCEGFDWLETADLPNAYGAMSNVQHTGTMTQTIEEGGGRNGDKSLKIIPGVGSADLNFDLMQGKSFPMPIAAGTESIIGFAVKFETIQDSGNLAFAGLTNGLVDASKHTINLIRLNSGFIAAGHGVNGLFAGATGSTPLNAGVWYYVELKYLCDNSAGIIEVHVNGSVEFNLTSFDSQITTSDAYLSLTLGSTIPNEESFSQTFEEM